MKLKTVPVILALGVLAACSSSPRTVELDPENVNRPAEDAPSGPTWLERLFGADPRPNVGPCPLMGVLHDSARIVEFAQPSVQRYANISFTGEVRGVRGLCRYVDDDPIRMGLEIDMAFGRGPAATSDTRVYRYWVAVTRRGGAVLQRATYEVPVRFEGGQAIVERQERIERIEIPRANATTSGENFEILVGFELTPEQLAFNRDGRRFVMTPGSATPQAQAGAAPRN